MNTANSIVRALFLYHLAEFQSGNATIIHIDLREDGFQISDNGRGHAIHKTINGIPYLKLVYSHMEYPFDLDSDTPVQLHTIGISLINALCKDLIVTVHKKDATHIQIYKKGQLQREESRENLSALSGNTLTGQFDSERIHDKVDLKDMEDWLRRVKSINSGLTLVYSGKEL